MEIIKAFQNNQLNIPISILGSSQEPLLRASDIGTVLGVVNIHTTIKDFDNTEKVIHSMETKGGPQNVTFLTVKGLKKLICKTRKPKGIELAKKLGIDVYDIMHVPLETSVVNFITTVFNKEEHETQYSVGKYKIDLYFPKLKLAIECDECFHIFQKEEDEIREKYITDKLDCKFLRYKQKDDLAKFISIIKDEIDKNKDIKIDELEKEIKNKLIIIETQDMLIKAETEYLKQLKILVKKGVSADLLFPDDTTMLHYMNIMKNINDEINIPRNGLDHKQVETKYRFSVDEEMVDIINTLRENNIFTNNSCQRQTNTVEKRCNNKTWICFDGIYDVKRLLDMCEINTEFYEYLHKQDWDIVLDPDDFEDYITNVDSYNYSLRFPYEDLLYFTNELIEIMKIYDK